MAQVSTYWVYKDPLFTNPSFWYFCAIYFELKVWIDLESGNNNNSWNSQLWNLPKSCEKNVSRMKIQEVQ